jgi:hypothetical protein
MVPRETQLARVGAMGFDVDMVIAPTIAKALRNAGMIFAVRYLGSLTSAECDSLLGAGLALMPVTFADAWNGPQTVAQLRACGILEGVTVWLDVEGLGGDPTTAAEGAKAKIRTWADEVRAAGFDPGLYVGAQALLTSQELYELPVDRYWHSMSRITDRNGALAAPICGWCMHQLYPTVPVAGIPVDVNFIQKDFRDRLPTWMVAAP